jgi:hypothetical protein
MELAPKNVRHIQVIPVPNVLLPLEAVLGLETTADGPSQPGALSPSVSNTSSPDLLMQSENISINRSSSPLPLTPAATYVQPSDRPLKKRCST